MNNNASVDLNKPIDKRKSVNNILMSEESVDDEYEIDLIDEDEQHKAPLIKGSKGLPQNKLLNGKTLGKFTKSKRKELSESSVENDEDKDLKKKSQHSLNTPPPITIGKIKIFKPNRRHRALRIRRFIRKFCILLFAVLFFGLILYNIASLPEFIKVVLGWSTFSSDTRRKDISTKCDRVVSLPIWRQNFPMLTVESALRLLDVNNDTVLDIIVPFGTGIDAAYYDSTLCQIYFNQTEVESKLIGCGGGVMAIDGTNGEPIWAQYTPHELFATNCNEDLNLDGQKDCLIGGRMASLYAFDGKTGKILWSINSNSGDPIAETSNFYTPLIIPKDLNGDSVSEFVVMHGGDPLRKANEQVQNVAKLMVLSGKTGEIIKWSYVPGNSESYYSPQLLVHPDGTLLILYGTGGETHLGGLYVVGLDALLNGQLEHSSRPIYEDCCKGVITPPVLVDINEDDILDIIIANFNSTVIAFDGLTFEHLWERKFSGSETYSTPSVGYFNDDNVPDFGVIYQYGPGFPIYYYSEFNVIDGRNGNLLLKEPIRMSIGTQSSPLTVSTFAQNDIFLFWYSSCSNETFDSQTSKNSSGNNNSELKDDSSFQIVSGSTVHESSRADFCKLRLGDKAQQFTQYRAITMSSQATFYDSRTDEPIVEKLNFTEMAYKWLQNNMAKVDSGTNFDDKIVSFPNNDDNVWGSIQNDPNLYGAVSDRLDGIKDDNIVYSPEAFEQLKKYKKWSIPADKSSDDPLRKILFSHNPSRRRFYTKSNETPNNRKKRHVGLHNGDSVQRVISTGTLAPSLPVSANSRSLPDQLPVDGSIDVIFATYSFLASSKVRLMSDAMRNCIQNYMTPEKETQMRLMDNSVFKQLGYDHDAYEAAVNELCAKETGQLRNSDEEQVRSTDPLKANNLIREMGSMTLHRVNLKCFDQNQKKQVSIKEYRYQWWPSYLGIMGDAIVNMIDA